MKQGYAVYVAAACVLAPLLWVIFTVDIGGKKNGYILLTGSFITVGVVLGGLIRAHSAGRFAPNRCGTCDSPMRKVQPGELRPPAGRESEELPTWRCGHCGRLV